jgi:hypothetical protein
MSRELRR